MPSNFLAMDSNFPSFTGNESPKHQIAALHNYLYQLREGLQYSLNNLSKDNFNPKVLEQLSDEQKEQISKQLVMVNHQMSQLSTEIDRLKSAIHLSQGLEKRVDDLEEWTGEAEMVMRDLELRLDKLYVEGEGEEAPEGVVADLERRLAAIEGTITVEEDGTVTIGKSDSTVRMEGAVYINGVLMQNKDGEQEEMT